MGAFHGLVRLAGLYRDHQAQLRPTRPWIIDLSVIRPYEGVTPGNVADFETAADMLSWQIGDTPSDPAQQLQWVRIEDEGRLLLISDRVLLMRISWDDLNEAGYVQGRPVAIDGRRYLCRLLTGGSRFRVEGDACSGGWPTANEWDRYVAAESSLEGLPTPSPTDLDDTLDWADQASPHNALWNWFGAVSCVCEDLFVSHLSRWRFHQSRCIYNPVIQRDA